MMNTCSHGNSEKKEIERDKKSNFLKNRNDKCELQSDDYEIESRNCEEKSLLCDTKEKN